MRTGGETQLAWWESELPALEQQLRAHLRRRLPSLRAHHDDLVNETLAALAERIAKDPGAYPAAWTAPGAPDAEADRAYLTKLALTILRRRTADLFRRGAHRWGAAPDVEDREPAREPGTERQLLLARMLRRCVALLAELSPEDRDLLTAAAGLEDEPARPLDARERQRLHRARQKLAEALRRELGDDVAALLRGED